MNMNAGEPQADALAGRSRTVLVLGASGMLGNAVLRFFATSRGFAAVGSVRSRTAKALLPSALHGQLVLAPNVENADDLLELFSRIRPDFVINCIGVVKQL